MPDFQIRKYVDARFFKKSMTAGYTCLKGAVEIASCKSRFQEFLDHLYSAFRSQSKGWGSTPGVIFIGITDDQNAQDEFIMDNL